MSPLDRDKAFKDLFDSLPDPPEAYRRLAKTGAEYLHQRLKLYTKEGIDTFWHEVAKEFQIPVEYIHPDNLKEPNDA